MIKDYSIRLMNEADSGGGDGGGAPAPTDGGTALGGAAPAPVDVTPTPEPAGVSIPDNWKDALPQDLREDPSMGPINNLESLVKSFVHSQKMIGKGKMNVPDKHASDEDWNQAFRALGLPETLEDYQFQEPKDHNFDDGFLTKLKEVGFQNGILPKQMEALTNWYNNVNNEALQMQEQEHKVRQEQSLNTLKQEWGQAFDQRLNMAKAAIRATENADQVFDWLNETGLGDDPQMIKLLSAMGQMFKEDSLVGDFGEPVAGPKELDSRIQELQASPAFMDRSHVNHKKVIDELQHLFQQKHPSQSKGNGLLT